MCKVISKVSEKYSCVISSSKKGKELMENESSFFLWNCIVSVKWIVRSRKSSENFTMESYIYIYIYIINCKHEWVQISLSTPLTRPCATYVLWRKQKAGNTHVCKNKINK